MNTLTLYRVSILLAGILFIGGFASCEFQMKDPKDFKLSENVSSKNQVVVPGVDSLPLFITYHLDSLETAAEVDSFKSSYTDEEQEFIFALNRMDGYRLKAGDQIVIPDTLTGNFLDYSPFPVALEMMDSISKAVIISRRVQAFGLYEKGKLIRWGAISSGKQSSPTPAGLFYGNFKARSKVSTVEESWILPYYFNFLNFDGVGVHQYAMPGYPASHACVRLFEKDAIAIYNWAEQWKLDKTGRVVERNGTPFMVFGDYDFNKPVPWLELVENPNANYLTSGEMETLRGYVTAYRKDPRNFDPPDQDVEPLTASLDDTLETIQ